MSSRGCPSLVLSNFIIYIYIGRIFNDNELKVRHVMFFSIEMDGQFTRGLVEKIVNDTTDDMDKVLLTREAFWCAQLCTLQPYGLDKRSEFNSKNRIRFN